MLHLSEAKYVLDTNIFINMQRRYPPDVIVFSSLWVKIEEAIDSGIIISCDEVLDELRIGSDDLLKWAKQRRGAFLTSGKDIQLIVRDILRTYPELLTGTKKANNADPFVIALAIYKGCTLVSDEAWAGKGNPVAIPNVCKAYDVRLIKFIDFLREI